MVLCNRTGTVGREISLLGDKILGILPIGIHQGVWRGIVPG